jgi:hypothetical protein
MPYPPIHPVKPLREYLFHPLHDIREFKPIHGPHIEREPVILQPYQPKLKSIPHPGLGKHPGEQGHGVSPPEQGFPVVNAGTYLIPNTLTK